MEAKKKELSDTLKMYITDHIKGQSGKIKDKSFIDFFLEKLPTGAEIKKTGSPFLFRDSVASLPSFIPMLYCGMDFHILIFEICIFNTINFWVNETLITMFIVYLIEKVI